MKAYVEPEEVDLMEKAASNLRDKILIRLLFRLGCRVSEALGIKVEDIDMVNHTITIQHLKARTQLSCSHCGTRLSRSHSYCPGCGAEVTQAQQIEMEHRRQRTIPVDKETLNLLADYIKRGGPVNRNNKRLLFGVNRHRAWQIVRGCAERVGLPKLINRESGRTHYVSPQCLRTAFAVMAVKTNDSGDAIRMLQEHMGHQSITTTMKYRKVSGEEQKQWYDRLWEEKSGN